MITHKCEYCGKEKQYKSPSLVKRFCSKQCYQEYAKRTGIRKRNGFWMENGYKVLYNNGNSRKEHILVMEQHIGRKLKPDEIVHHIDGNKTNNDISNLQLMTAQEHSRMHREKEINEGKQLF